MKKNRIETLEAECKGKKSETILSMALNLIDSRDTEAITYLYEILKTRKRQKFANQLFRELKKVNLEPVPFLLKARSIAQKFKKTTKGAHHLYVVLLEKDSKENYGLYVGETFRTPENRLQYHKDGPIEGRKKQHARCYKRMSVLLPSLFEHLNPLSRKEGKEIEELLAHAYREGGIMCDGGDKKKFKDQS
jgi:hypothetical protein